MYHLAQVNIARMIAPLTDPLMAGFVAQLAPVNAIADASPGFIWRLQTPAGDATSLRPYTDPLILFNMSVWTSLNTSSSYVYATESLHREVMKQRRRWFQRFDGPYSALWRVPQDHIPDVEEAKDRLEYLRLHGESPYAFTHKKPFPAPNTNYEPLIQQPEECLS